MKEETDSIRTEVEKPLKTTTSKRIRRRQSQTEKRRREEERDRKCCLLSFLSFEIRRRTCLFISRRMLESVGHVCVPSRLGRFIEELVDDQCRIYSLDIPTDFIDQFDLRQSLKSFASRTFVNEIKRHFFYSSTMRKMCRSQICRSSSPMESTFEEELLKSTDSSRFNFVLTADCLIFVRLPRCRHVSFHLLAKHFFLADQSADKVKFAGELWTDENKNIRVNNNSGTYRPDNHLIRPMVKLFKHLAPSLTFQGFSFRATQRPNFQRRLNDKIQRKFHLKREKDTD